MSSAQEFCARLAGKHASAEKPLLALGAVGFRMKLRGLGDCRRSEYQDKKDAARRDQHASTQRAAGSHYATFSGNKGPGLSLGRAIFPSFTRRAAIAATVRLCALAISLMSLPSRNSSQTC